MQIQQISVKKYKVNTNYERNAAPNHPTSQTAMPHLRLTVNVCYREQDKECGDFRLTHPRYVFRN